MAKLTASQDISDFLATADDAEARDSLGIVGSSLTLISDASGGTTGFALSAIPDDWKVRQSTLTGLQIGNSVTTIGSFAFNYCSGFTGALMIPSSVTTIGSSAFNNCTGFTGALTIPSSFTAIGDYVFFNCYGFTELTIPNSVTTIGSSAFNYCSGFTGTLTIPSSVTTIRAYAFQGCSGFTGALTIPSSVTSIEIGSFDSCINLTSANIYITKTIINAATNCFLNSGITTIHVRASDATWAASGAPNNAGLQTIGGKSGITVIKDL